VSDEICVACGVARKPVASELADFWHQIVFYKCPSCASVLKCAERNPSSPRDWSNMSKEIKCEACKGTGFAITKKPVQPGRRIYPERCNKCDGKGRIIKADD
jgi:hypothetical protein